MKRMRICLLTVIHLALGLICALAVILNPMHDWPIPAGIAAISLIGSQMLLLGMWAGLSNLPWWTRLFGVILGMGYILIIGITVSESSLFQIGGLLVLPTMIVLLLFLFIRWLYARVISFDNRITNHVPDNFRVSMKQLLCLTLGTSIVLAFGRTVRSFGGEAIEMGVFAIVIAMWSALIMLLLVWSSLGRGRAFVRLPLVIGGAAIIGLVPPYYFGGPWGGFVICPVLATSVATIVGCSLLVIRTCSYRYVLLSDIGAIDTNQLQAPPQMKSVNEFDIA